MEAVRDHHTLTELFQNEERFVIFTVQTGFLGGVKGQAGFICFVGLSLAQFATHFGQQRKLPDRQCTLQVLRMPYIDFTTSKFAQCHKLVDA